MKGWFVLLPLLLAGCAPDYQARGHYRRSQTCFVIGSARV
jgi:hypothetical protein